MKISTLSLTLAAALFISGCQSLPPTEAEPAVAVAPSIEPAACPVCPLLECPEPEVREVIVTQYVTVPAAPVAATPVLAGELSVRGAVEWAFVEPGEVFLKARIDSGAETSSMHAENIQLVEKDGKRYVRFSIQHPDTKELIPLERRLHRRIVVKQNVDAPPDRRYVVRMWVSVGKTRSWLDVSLSDRNDFEYALLLGRDLLMDEFVIDVSKRYTQAKKRPEVN